MSRRPRASGYFRTDYGEDLSLLPTRLERLAVLGVLVVLLALPLLASPFLIDLATQVFLAVIGALALMLLTGYAGQVSLGHAGLLAAGAFTVGILFKEFKAPFFVTLPAAAAVGALLGVVFGLPSLRVRGLYLAVSTLALNFLVAYLGGEYETRRGFSTGILVDPPETRRQGGDRRTKPGMSFCWRPPSQPFSSAPISCAPARGAPGPPSAPTKRWRKHSASALPATNC